MEMWSQLNKFSDGESLNAETLNIPIGQLGDRTSYLYARLKELMSSGKMSSVVLTDVSLSTEKGKIPEVGNAVYLDNETGRFAAAKASMSLYDDFTAADSAFTLGILQWKKGNTGNVIVYGRLDMSPSGTKVTASSILHSGEKFRPGRYYLSADEAGRLTANPTGPLIYVCTISGGVDLAGWVTGTAVVSPQYLDIGTSHVHRSAVLTARPAGTLSTDGYLPIDETAPQGASGPLAIRFGGKWTSNEEVDYSFYLDSENASWNENGVVLKWKENGLGNAAFSVVIHAPDEEVQISHGLTARVSFPSATPETAYEGISNNNQRTWGTLTLPDAGKGWLRHEPVAVCSGESGDAEGLRVAVKGRFRTQESVVNVCIPKSAQVLRIGSVSEGSTFTYDGVTYEFGLSGGSASLTNAVFVPLGSSDTDSVLFLAEEMRKQGAKGTFAVFDGAYEDGELTEYPSMVIIDGIDVNMSNVTIFTHKDTYSQSEFTVPGAYGMSLVVFDGNGMVLGGSAVISGVDSCVWNESGDISVMVYNVGYEAIAVTGDASLYLSASARDDEPDAAYDYVIGLDPAVSMYWPPVPPKSAALVVNGIEMDNKAILPEHPTVSFGRDTVHWFEDGKSTKPWPEAFLRRGVDIDPSIDKFEVMRWVRCFQGATGPVTSLQPREGAPIKILGYGTDASANTGDLEIDAELDIRMENGGAPGYLVPKRSRSGRLVSGPVVERIIGGQGISLISQAGSPEGQGTVVVALENGAYGSMFSDIALENAEQAKIGMFPYIRLKGYTGQSISSPSAFTATMRVPTNLPEGNYSLSISASVFGETGFTGSSVRYACVKMAYNILPDFTAVGEMRYSDLKTSLLKPDSERMVYIPFGHYGDNGTVYQGFDPVFVTTTDKTVPEGADSASHAFGDMIPSAQEFARQIITPELKPGYLVGIRISRAVTDSDGKDPYQFALGFLNLSWSLSSSNWATPSRKSSSDVYVKDKATGLFHELSAVTDSETGQVDIGIEQDGVIR